MTLKKNHLKRCLFNPWPKLEFANFQLGDDLFILFPYSPATTSIDRLKKIWLKGPLVNNSSGSSIFGFIASFKEEKLILIVIIKIGVFYLLVANRKFGNHLILF